MDTLKKKPSQKTSLNKSPNPFPLPSIVFFGTPTFSATCLEFLHEQPQTSEKIVIGGVVTQEDRPAGRKLKLQASPVKQYAQNQNLPHISCPPLKEKKEILLQQLKVWKGDLALVIAFGQILPSEILNLFPYGAINVHTSLLPRWRGAAPIQRAIEAGDTLTGVTLQKMSPKLDAGDILAQEHIPLPLSADAQRIHNQLLTLSQKMLLETLPPYFRGKITPQPQNEKLSCYAKKIQKKECLIQWGREPLSVYNHIRAFTLSPYAYSFFRQKKTLFHHVEWVEEKTLKTFLSSTKVIGAPKAINTAKDSQKDSQNAKEGSIIFVDKKRLFIQLKKGVALAPLALQVEGRKKVSIESFISGYQPKVGEKFCLPLTE